MRFPSCPRHARTGTHRHGPTGESPRPRQGLSPPSSVPKKSPPHGVTRGLLPVSPQVVPEGPPAPDTLGRAGRRRGRETPHAAPLPHGSRACPSLSLPRKSGLTRDHQAPPTSVGRVSDPTTERVAPLGPGRLQRGPPCSLGPHELGDARSHGRSGVCVLLTFSPLGPESPLRPGSPGGPCGGRAGVRLSPRPTLPPCQGPPTPLTMGPGGPSGPGDPGRPCSP